MNQSNKTIWLVVLALAFLFYRHSDKLNVIPGGGAPFPAEKICVLIVEETSDRTKLPQAQLVALIGPEWREAVRSKGGEFRQLDKETDVANDAPWVQAAMRVPRDSLPWVLISNGRSGHSGPLPADAAKLLELLARYGG